MTINFCSSCDFHTATCSHAVCETWVSERLIPLIVDDTLNEVIEPKWSLVTFLPVVSSHCSPVSASLCVQLSEVDDHLQKALWGESLHGEKVVEKGPTVLWICAEWGVCRLWSCSTTLECFGVCRVSQLMIQDSYLVCDCQIFHFFCSIFFFHVVTRKPLTMHELCEGLNVTADVSVSVWS